MSKTHKLIGILTFLAIFGLVFWGCGDGGGGNTELPELTGTVSISGTAEVGQTLTAVTSALGGSGTISYQWKHGASDIGTNSSTYTIKLEDAGGAITVTVTRSGNTGSVTSLPTDSIPTPGLQFTLLGGGNAYSVSRGTATGSVITIPAIHEGKPVTTIADNGFLGYTNLTSIIIPNGITRIGSYAFYQCENLVSVVIPTVVVIGNFAFDGCSSLEKVFYRGASITDWATTMLSGQGLNNAPLTNAKIYYYSAENPLKVDSHWYLYDGQPRIWINYSITFNSNGGSAVASQIVPQGGYTATRPANPTRSGHIFDNWYSNEGLTTLYNFNNGVYSNITLYAKWLAPSTVTFNSNGGSSVSSQSVTHGNTATRPTNPTRSGFVFDNWYSNEGLTTLYNFSTPVTANITLYAKWLGLYTVTFNSNSGSSVSSQSITHGSTATRPTNPTRSGFVFDNWYSNEGLTTVYNFSTPVTANITLYAKWFGPSTVTFNSNGGSSIAAQNITHGGTATRPTNPTRSGFVFDNWYSDAGLTTVYNFSTAVTSNVTLYAKWNQWNGIEMVQISAGTYTRGSSNSADNGASPPHQVTLTSGFYMGKYEVTQEQYQAVMGVNPSGFSSNPAAGETQGRRPVERVTWFDAIEFCNKLSEFEGRTPVYTITGRSPATGYPITSATVTANWNANGYRLPTEAEWEYACRAGTTTAWSFGDNQSELGNYAWFSSNSNSMTHEVGKKLPNAWGLYDMHGNVSEWCWDRIGDYTSGAQTDPRGPSNGTDRVRRGGGWSNSTEYTRSANRVINDPGSRDIFRGFRVARP